METQQLADYAYYEVAFPAQGDLGIGIKVDKDGLVVVSDVKKLKGYAELLCPEIASGDILVAVDHEPMANKSFQQVMAVLHASQHTRPTRLAFLSVDYYADRMDIVAKWTERHRLQSQDSQHEGELDVDFEPLQPTGLRFTESYVMATPLRLASVDDAAILSLQEHVQLRKLLLNMVLVRIGAQSVLGAPVNEVTALLQCETESDGATSAFPKSLWLASAVNLDEDYVVLTLSHLEQLKWLSFEPMEMMMEVPAVSFAAKAVTDQPVSDSAPQRERRDGIKSEQYLMAINGISTLRLSAPASSSASSTANSLFHDGRETQKPLLEEVTKALDGLVGCARTLRFRDLTQYRREFQQQRPLSPWSRQRRSESHILVDSEASLLLNGSSKTTSSAASASRQSVASDFQELRSSIIIARRPRDLLELLKKEEVDIPSVDLEQRCPDEAHDPVSDAVKRPHIKKYRDLADCEGTRRPTSSKPAIADENVKTLVIADNLRPVGMQLETELMTTLVVFKRFTRMNGPALASKQVARGDLIISINGSSVEDIPTDTLIRLLQGESQKPSSDKTPSGLQSVRILKFARRKPRHAVTTLFAGMWTRSSTRVEAHEKATGTHHGEMKKKLMVEFTDLEDELRAAI